MAMIANLQYGWTVFVDPMSAQMGWGRTAIQVSFTIFVLVETWLVPFEAALVDRYGPRVMVAIGGVLAGIAWVIDGNAHSLPVLYLPAHWPASAPASYTAPASANALKWFAGRRRPRGRPDLGRIRRRRCGHGNPADADDRAAAATSTPSFSSASSRVS